MAGELQPRLVDNLLPVLWICIGVTLLTEPIVGYSEMLPEGVFYLVFGVLLLGTSLFSYVFRTDSEEQ
jgi:hypothetical protein